MKRELNLSPGGRFLHERLDKVFPREWLEQQARETGLVKRMRAFSPFLLFWVLVLQSGVYLQGSLEAIRRRYNEHAEQAMAHSSFYERFTPELVEFLHRCMLRGLEQLSNLNARELSPRLKDFKDILIQDSTIIRLHEKLHEQFPATRSKKVAAGVKLATLVSVVADGPTRVTLHGERVSEVKTLNVGPWVKDRILLLDLGFFKYQLLTRIKENGGFFVTRLKDNADPLITKVNRNVRGNSIQVENEFLQHVLPRLKRDVLDVEAEVHFKRRKYNGRSRLDTTSYRVVAIRHPDTGKYHTYLTNLPDTFTAEEIQSLYRARWEVELLFRELKKNFAIDQVPTANPQAVEALLWTGILTLTIHRVKFLTLLELNPDKAPYYSHERHAKSFQERGAHALFQEILWRHDLPYDSMDTYLIDECGAFDLYRKHGTHINEWRV